jgi:hypothetical protein
VVVTIVRDDADFTTYRANPWDAADRFRDGTGVQQPHDRRRRSQIVAPGQWSLRSFS